MVEPSTAVLHFGKVASTVWVESDFLTNFWSVPHIGHYYLQYYIHR